MKPHPRWQMPIRRWLCRTFGHREVRLTGYYEKRVRTGFACTRCHAARAREYHGQYPMPKAQA